MEKIRDLKHLVEIIKSNNINFIGFAVTPWHANGIDVAYNYIKKCYKTDITEAIIIVKHSDTGYAIDSSDFTNRYSRIFYMDILNSNYYGAKYNKVLYKYCFGNICNFSRRKELIIANHCFSNHIVSALLYDTLLDYHITRIICDEGVATYMKTLDTNKSSSFIKRTYRYIRCQFVDFIISTMHPVINMNIFKQSFWGSKLLDNKFVYPYYHHVFQMQCEKKQEELDLRKTIVICTTAWKRTSVLDNEDLRVLKIITDDLFARGYSLALKTHPRDHFFEEYCDDLHCKNISNMFKNVESICALSKPLAIISFSSTALITSSLFWNIPTFCISDMLDASKLSDEYKKEIQRFKSVFKEKTCFVSTTNEIIMRLNTHPSCLYE